MAIERLLSLSAAASAVMRFQVFEPSEFITITTSGKPFWSMSARASTITSPSNGALPSLVFVLMAYNSKILFSLIAFTAHKNLTFVGKLALTSGIAKIAFTLAVSFCLAKPITGPCCNTCWPCSSCARFGVKIANKGLSFAKFSND